MCILIQGKKKEEELTVGEQIWFHITQFYLYILTFFNAYVFVQLIIHK